MTLRMELCSSRLAESLKLTEVSFFSWAVNTHPAVRTSWQTGQNVPCRSVSTVLAQDHFLSDFLSLHLTSKTHKVSMMMVLDVGTRTSSSACAADLMSVRCPHLSEWLVAPVFD